MKTKTVTLKFASQLSLFSACFVLALSGLVSLASVRADTVAETTGGHTFISAYFGQSFTTVTVTPESNIAFNFFSDTPATTPYALGTGFLLSMEYLGTPADLSSATPGFLGEATASGGFYTFNPSLTLLPATQYFFYENTLIPLTESITGGDLYAGGQGYFARSAGDNFVSDVSSENFRVTGSPISAVPDTGSTWMLLLLGLTAIFGVFRAPGSVKPT